MMALRGQDPGSSSQPVALVTGGRAGLGRATAMALADRGYQVFPAFRGTKGGFEACASELVEAASRLGHNVHPVCIDVTDARSVDAGVGSIIDAVGRIDVLVNAAGFGAHGPWESFSVEQLRSTLETNLIGCFRVCKTVVPAMRQQRCGYIVNYSSQAGLRASFWEAPYAASKYGLEGLSLSMRLELRQFGVRVCMINPGWYADTEYGEAWITTEDWLAQRGPYGTLAARFFANQPAVEVGQSPLSAVAERVVELLDLDDPPFDNPVGCAAPRTMSGSVGDYERSVFSFYSLTDFMPFPAPTEPSKNEASTVGA